MGVLIVGIGTLVFMLLAYRKRWRWTGFVVDAEADDVRPGQHTKTLWDWLRLLLIPIVLVAAGGALNITQSDRERARSLDDQREQALHDYLDEMSALILDRHLGDAANKSIDTTQVIRLAETRTLSTLRFLDGARKGIVVRFLADTNLITGDPTEDPDGLGGGAIFLNGADLRGADLSAADLCRLQLYAPDMTGANLDGADIGMSWIMVPNLTDASFRDANLSGTYMALPDLERTDFTGADLRGISLDEPHGADTLFAAADLRGSWSDLKGLVDPRFSGAIVSPESHVEGALGLGAVSKDADPNDKPGCWDIIPFKTSGAAVP